MNIVNLKTLGLGVIASGLLLAGAPSHAETWSFPVFEQQPRGFVDPRPKLNSFTYRPLEKASKKWDLCVSIPHLKDPYWLAVDYGLVSEARRLGVKMTLLAPGGYTELPKQFSQIEDCVAKGGEAVVVGGVSFTGLDKLVEELDAKGIPVVDLGNGLNSPKTKAHAATTYYFVGKASGEFLAKNHPKGSAEVKVLWLPGPPGAGWSETADEGFKDGIAGSAVKILETKFGETGKAAQLKIVEDKLQAYPDIDYIVGVAPAAEAAVGAMREAGRKNVRIMSFYQTPGVIDLLKKGSVHAVGSDNNVIIARIAIDLAVRILEGKKFVEHVGPGVSVVDPASLGSWDRDTSLAPAGWSAVFKVD